MRTFFLILFFITLGTSPIHADDEYTQDDLDALGERYPELTETNVGDDRIRLGTGYEQTPLSESDRMRRDSLQRMTQTDLEELLEIDEMYGYETRPDILNEISERQRTGRWVARIVDITGETLESAGRWQRMGGGFILVTTVGVAADMISQAITGSSVSEFLMQEIETASGVPIRQEALELFISLPGIQQFHNQLAEALAAEAIREAAIETCRINLSFLYNFVMKAGVKRSNFEAHWASRGLELGTEARGDSHGVKEFQTFQYGGFDPVTYQRERLEYPEPVKKLYDALVNYDFATQKEHRDAELRCERLESIVPAEPDPSTSPYEFSYGMW